MTRLENLRILHAAVKDGHLPTFQVSYAALGEAAHDADRAMGGSLDSAFDLHSAFLPGWEYQMDNVEGQLWVMVQNDGGEIEGQGRSDFPSRAWLTAILAALIAIEEEKP